MEFFLGVVFVVATVIAGVALFVSSARKGQERMPEPSRQEPWPYYAKSVMTGTELEVYRRLQVACPNHQVLAQVGLSRILGVQRGHNVATWNNRINRMSVDFLVCDEYGRVVAAIELDDPTHDRPDRIEADRKKDRALASAGIRLIRWRNGAVPEIPVMKAQITPPVPVPTPVP